MANDAIRHALPEQLSAREAQVLEMAALGLTNGQVAERLKVSVHAVKFHLGSVYRKLGVANRTEAAVVYLRGESSKPKPFSEAPEGR